MNFNELLGLDQRCEKLLSLVTDYDTRMTTLKAYYQTMLDEVSNSEVDSTEYWTNRANVGSTAATQSAGIAIERINDILEKMEAVIKKLSEVDTLFKYYYKKHHNDQSLIEIDLNNNHDYASMVQNMYDELFAVANECSSTIKSVPVQGLEMFFSSNRRAKYSRILSLYSQATQIADVACVDLPRKASSDCRSLVEQKEREIADAKNECLELTNAIQDEFSEEKDKTIKEFTDAIVALFPKKLQDTIREYIDKNSSIELQPEFSPTISVGYFSAFLGIANNEEIKDIIEEELEPLLLNDFIELPSVFSAKTALSFAIRYEEESQKEEATELSLSLVFSQLANSPAGCQHFVFADPEERTKSFRPYMDFIGLCPEVFNQKILTTKEQIADSLKQLCNYIDVAAQKRFVGHENIYEYNKAVPDKIAPYQTLVLIDFPKYFDETMLDNLWSIVNSGAPFGVGIIIQENEQFYDHRNSERYFSYINRIIEKCIPLKCMFRNLWCFSENVYFKPLQFSEDVLYSFKTDYMRQYEERKNSGIPLSRVVDLTQIGVGSTKDLLSIPFAIDETGAVHSFEVGDPVASGISHYALITGATGSGKSTLLHTLVMSAIIKYPPEEIQIYLMDFKKGTEFKVYAEHPVPHIKLIAIDSMQEFGLSILSEIQEEKNRRAQLFKEASIKYGTDIRNITTYRDVTKAELPRILLILDEFQVLYDCEKNRKVANECAKITTDLLSMARVYGINIVFSTQLLTRLNSEYYSVSRSSFTDVHVRIGLKGTSTEADLLFGSGKGRIAFGKYTEEKGTGAYVDDDTTGTPIGIRCAYCSDKLQIQLLDDVQELYHDSDNDMRIFSGDIVPSINDAKELRELGKPISGFLLGEPIMVSSNFMFMLEPRRRSNLLIIGSSIKMINQLTKLILFSFDRFFPPTSYMYYADGDLFSGGVLSADIKQYIHKQNLVLIENESNFLDVIYKTYMTFTKARELQHRNDNEKTIIFLNNIQWLEVAQKVLEGKIPNKNEHVNHNDTISEMEDPFAPLTITNNTKLVDNNTSSSPIMKTPSYQSMLMELMENGYLYGVHFVVASTDFQAIKGVFYEIGPYFSNRILFDINENDAYRLIPDIKIQNLPENVVVYTNGLNRTFQFKPFSIND